MRKEVSDTASGSARAPASERLDSWKEVAAYLKRDVSTVQRWEKREALPVHRHLHDRLGTVYAYKSEIDAWWNNRQPRLERQPAPRRLAWLITAAAVVLAGAFLAIWLSRARFRWQLSRTSTSSEMVARRVWAGPDVDRLGTISPDGRYVAYSDPATSDLVRREIATGEERRLTTKPPRSRAGGALFPVVSPDGKQIAYSWDQALFRDLRVIGMDGSRDRVVYHNPDLHTIEPRDWSPDGRQILAIFGHKDRTSEVVLVSVEDSSVRLLKTLDWRSPTKMSFSPDGRYIAYDFPPREDSSDRDIFLFSLADSSEVPLVEHSSGDFLLGWAPDGKGILFASDRTGTRDAWIMPVIQGKPGGPPILVKKDVGQIYPVGFTKSGSYYYGLQTWRTDVYVAALNLATGALLASPTPATQRYAGSNSSPDWSPDGRYLAYISQWSPLCRWAVPRVFIRSAATNEERELRLKLHTAESLRWSPDGRSFVATGNDSKDRGGVFQIDVQTGDAVPITQSREPEAYYYTPACSAVGNRVFFKLREGGMEPSRVLVHDLRASRQKEFLPSVYRFDISRDGQWLAFSSFDETSEFLEIVPVAGGQRRQVYREPRSGRINSVAWTPDGRHLLFAKRGELWRISIQGGTPEKLPLAIEGLRELRVHPDATRIAFTAGTPKGELWRLDNFLPAP